MPMLKICSAAGCTTRTLGEFCVDHEREAQRAPHVQYRRVETANEPPRSPGSLVSRTA